MTGRPERLQICNALNSAIVTHLLRPRELTLNFIASVIKVHAEELSVFSEPLHVLVIQRIIQTMRKSRGDCFIWEERIQWQRACRDSSHLHRNKKFRCLRVLLDWDKMCNHSSVDSFEVEGSILSMPGRLGWHNWKSQLMGLIKQINCSVEIASLNQPANDSCIPTTTGTSTNLDQAHKGSARPDRWGHATSKCPNCRKAQPRHQAWALRQPERDSVKLFAIQLVQV